MKKYHFRKYSIEDTGDALVIKTLEEKVTIQKSKIVNVFRMKYWNTSKVKWYHKVLFGLAFLLLTFFSFSFLEHWMNQYEKIADPTIILKSVTAILWSIVGVFFIGMIILFLEVGIGIPGISNFLSKLVIGRTKRYVVIQRKTVEYQLMVRKRKARALENEIKKMIEH